MPLFRKSGKWRCLLYFLYEPGQITRGQWPDSTFDALSAMIQYAMILPMGKLISKSMPGWSPIVYGRGLWAEPPAGIFFYSSWMGHAGLQRCFFEFRGMYLDPGIPGARTISTKSGWMWSGLWCRWYCLDYNPLSRIYLGYATTSLNRFNKLYSRTGKPSSLMATSASFGGIIFLPWWKNYMLKWWKKSLRWRFLSVPSLGYTTTDFYDSSAYNVFQIGRNDGRPFSGLSFPMIYDPESPDYRQFATAIGILQ
jgi:hypothetical protein